MVTRARDLMQTNVLTVPSEMSFLEVVRLFVVGQIDGAPVVDPEEKIVGVISATDLLRGADQAWDEDADEDEPEELAARLEALRAIDMASPDPIWVDPDMPAAQVASVMRREGIHRVLVGTGRRLQGILTTFDLLRWDRA